MYKIVILCSCLLFVGCNSEVSKKPISKKKELHTPTLNQYNAIWREITSDPLQKLPHERVSYAKLFDGDRDVISEDAKRTLEDRSNILAPFDKLAHPNGVCLSGVWKIDEENPFSGEFQKGRESLVIARASSAMDNTKRGENRAFGMAIKLFGTKNKQEILTYPTANFFVIDDLGGTDAPYYTDVAMSNEPDVSFSATVLGSLAYAIKVASAFSDADSHSGIRQLYEVSNLGTKKSKVITPKWIKIQAQKGQTALGVNDFRDEFKDVAKKSLVFNISVASREIDDKKEWKKIGTITFNKSVVSTSCDHRLHFHHPVWRDDLVYE
jgi:hypothetical protein